MARRPAGARSPAGAGGDRNAMDKTGPIGIRTVYRVERDGHSVYCSSPPCVSALLAAAAPTHSPSDHLP